MGEYHRGGCRKDRTSRKTDYLVYNRGRIAIMKRNVKEKPTIRRKLGFNLVWIP
jgi:hypothetical protein